MGLILGRGSTYEDTIDLRSFTNNLSSCGNKAERDFRLDNCLVVCKNARVNHVFTNLSPVQIYDPSDIPLEVFILHIGSETTGHINKAK